MVFVFFFFKQKTAYEMRISDWSSDVCSSDLAFVNMLALLGWTPPGEQEIMGLDEMARAFQLEKVHKAGSKYNYEKACWFNQQYLHQNSVAELAALFLPILEEKGLNPKGFGTDEEAKSGSENYLTRVVSLIKDRCTLIPDLWDQSRFFFQRPHEYEAEPVKKKRQQVV